MFQSGTAGPMAMLNPPSVYSATSRARRSRSKVSALTPTGLRPAAWLTRDSSLVSIQVLSRFSRRRISRKPAVSDACAMASLGATAVISTSVPMRNWARLTVTEADAGLDAGGEAGRARGMIAQAVKNGIQASRKRAARRCIGSESSKEQAQCHGGKRVAPDPPLMFCYNVAAMKPYVLQRGPHPPPRTKFFPHFQAGVDPRPPAPGQAP